MVLVIYIILVANFFNQFTAVVLRFKELLLWNY